MGASQSSYCADGSQAPPPPPPSPTSNDSQQEAPPPPPSLDSENDDIAKAAANATAYANPGPWEAFNSDIKRYLFVDTFDGARVDLSKQLSPFLVINHNWWLGTTQLPNGQKNNYTFTTQVMPSETTAVIGRADGNGMVEARVHRGLIMTEDLQANAKLVCVTTPEFNEQNQMVADLDLAGKTWSGQIKYGAMMGGNVFGLNFVQAVTPSLSVGGDAMYLGSQNTSIGSYGVKYTGNSWCMAGQWNGLQQSFFCHYKKEVTKDRVTLAAEMQVQPGSGESAVTFGGEFNLKQSKISTVIDGSGCMKTVLDTKLGPAASVIFSGEVDHMKDNYKFGYGLTIGG
ncbi:hypothetical protein TrVE_jg6862 [Triparma verrucosa]|uniref:Uncharacterized protein n=1 Tax=Triparma verrucosa TaxID=1606542 RepID=A0A9W7BMW1_9STRA|nr:hypothetical protein TrVE_jg6862 [Triparma verrucosa]|mmetsp:Transcript_27308/g.51763  ORF Transcript_27308/g.51763 Transcript_27308/m.51763 type:complete len:342 (+) Transcript_27308:51-1076(+)